MQQFHNKTNINAKKNLTGSSFCDYRTQPRSYKQYPHFYQRYNISDFEELKALSFIGKITDCKKYGNVQVELRANPSAGGLYPNEIYIQLRGIKGLVNGIYHYEALKNSLCLIHELSNDGVENYFDENIQQKIIFLISTAYFRTSWKYENRSIRYLLLDTGHTLGNIYASLKLMDLPFELNFNFDKYSLNSEFSFNNFEFFFTSVTTKIHKELETKKLREPLINVCACDYQIKNSFIEEFYNFSNKDNYEKISNITLLDDIENSDLITCIEKRRSVRAFYKETISLNDYEFILKNILNFANNYNINIYTINNRINDLKKGVYKNVTLLKEGDFSLDATKIALNQKLSGDSAFTLIFTSNDEKNYFYIYTLVGFISQILYLRTTFLNLSISGLGAYFDDLCQDFLETNDDIFYLVSIGK